MSKFPFVEGGGLKSTNILDLLTCVSAGHSGYKNSSYPRAVISPFKGMPDFIRGCR